jgi:hypothetical protein
MWDVMIILNLSDWLADSRNSGTRNGLHLFRLPDGKPGGQVSKWGSSNLKTVRPRGWNHFGTDMTEGAKSDLSPSTNIGLAPNKATNSGRCLEGEVTEEKG